MSPSIEGRRGEEKLGGGQELLGNQEGRKPYFPTVKTHNGPQRNRGVSPQPFDNDSEESASLCLITRTCSFLDINNTSAPITLEGLYQG